MGIFDILTLIGGLCLFLFGMNVMGDGLERRRRAEAFARQADKQPHEGLPDGSRSDGGDSKLISNNGYGRWLR